jgi:hypothetical protein
VLAARFDNLREGARALIVADKATSPSPSQPLPAARATVVESASASMPLVK